MSKYIPNLLTISNLICGCIALHLTFKGNLVVTAYVIGLAVLFDFLDGTAARLLKTTSKIGKQLDSLADMVSFGLVPGAVIFQLIEKGALSQYSFIALAIPICSALRLAKFNVDERQNENFIGLPTPANCLVFVSLPLILTFHAESMMASIIGIPEVLLGLTIFLSISLVSRIKMFSLKFKNFKYKDNKLRFVFIVISMGLIPWFKYSAIPIIVLLYMTLSSLSNKE